LSDSGHTASSVSDVGSTTLNHTFPDTDESPTEPRGGAPEGYSLNDTLGDLDEGDEGGDNDEGEGGEAEEEDIYS
jgi:hypothetical protein